MHVTWHFPTVFLVLVTFLDIYLMARAGPVVYRLSLIIFYGFLSFMTFLFYWQVRVAVADLDMKPY